jgi:hypothetical protein
MIRKPGLRVGRRQNRWVDREQMAARRETIKRGLRWGVVVIACGLSTFHLGKLAHTRGWLSPFLVREVRVVGAEVAHPGVLVAEAGLVGKRLHYWSRLDDHLDLVLRDPLIVEASFERRLPNRLTLVVVERQPVALLGLERLTPVDGAGRVLPVSAFHGGWDVPVMMIDWPTEEVVLDGRVQVGPIRWALDWLGKVELAMPTLYQEISTVELDGDGTVRLRLTRSECTVLLDQNTPFEKLALLDDVLRDLADKGEAFFQLDLRFEDQIVVRRG